MMMYFHDCTLSFSVVSVPDEQAMQRRSGLSDGSGVGRMQRWKPGESVDEGWASRIAHISGVLRVREPDGSIRLRFLSIPAQSDVPMDERGIVERFFSERKRSGAQLFSISNPHNALDLLIQRGTFALAQSRDLARPRRRSLDGAGILLTTDYHVDLMEMLAGARDEKSTLYDLCAAAQLPVGMGMQDVDAGVLWNDGRAEEVMWRCQIDAVTTHLLMLHFAHFTGFMSHADLATEWRAAWTAFQSIGERVGMGHFGAYAAEWHDRHDFFSRLELDQSGPSQDRAGAAQTNETIQPAALS